MLVTYPNGAVWRFNNGGNRYTFTPFSPPTASNCQEFYAPLTETPRNPAKPAEAERMAFGTNRVWVSDTFGSTWASIPSNSIQDRLDPNDCRTTVGRGFRIRSLAFAGAN